MKTLFHSNPIFRYLSQFAGYLSVAVIVAACTIKAEDLPDSQASHAAPGVPVDATIIKPGELSDNLEVTGSILANQQVDIASELTRKVVSVLVKEGSTVRKARSSSNLMTPIF